MTSLIKPCTPRFNASLMAQVETKRYHCTDFSDAHWLMQLLCEYQGLFRHNHDGSELNQNPYAKMNGCAIESVFETFVRSGAKAAIKRAQALKDDGFPVMTWFPAPIGSPAQWTKTRKAALKDGVYHYTVEGD